MGCFNVDARLMAVRVTAVAVGGGRLEERPKG